MSLPVLLQDVAGITAHLQSADVPCVWLGSATREKTDQLSYNDAVVLDESMLTLRQCWEETSYQLERLQINPACAEEEKATIFDRPGPAYHFHFAPEPPSAQVLERAQAKGCHSS